MRFLDRTGERYGNLIVIKRAKNRGVATYWLCECDCGNIKEICGSHIASGKSTSCGCNRKKQLIVRNTKHGMSDTRFYKIYQLIQDRCKNPKNTVWKWYGGRGITCGWNSFEQFKKDMFNTYNTHLAKYGENQTTIDRIDNNKGYSKENCRWATYTQQGSNKSDNRMIKYKGKTKTLSEWVRKLGLNYQTTHYRLQKGWSVVDAFEMPNQRKNGRDCAQ